MATELRTFTKEFMQLNCGCYSREQLEKCSFYSLDEITIESILGSEIPLKDKAWFVCKVLATKEQNQSIAIKCAEVVLPIFEKKYPNDLRPREAIQATKDYLEGKIEIEVLRKKRMAASYASYSAADAASSYAASYAYAAAATAAAATAATAASSYAASYAYAAAYAASSYAASYYSAASYSAAADAKQEILNVLKSSI